MAVMSDEEKRERLLTRVARAIRDVEPSAQIYLFGSRARGDFGPESDWDLLVILEGPVDEKRKDVVRHHIYPVEWDEGEVLSARVVSREMWDSYPSAAMPLFRTVREEGIPV